MDERTQSEIFENLQRAGVIAPQKDNVLWELAEGAGYNAIQGLKGLGATLHEKTGISALEDWATEREEQNRNWAPPTDYRAASWDPAHIARTIGGGIASSLAPVAAGIIGSAASGNPLVGFGASAFTSYAMLYGDTVREYRKELPNMSETAVEALAMLSALGQAGFETLLGGEARFTRAIGKQLAREAAQETTRTLAARVGRGMVQGALEEGSEEVAQLYWDNLIKSAAKRDWVLPSWEEVKDSFAGGAYPGALFGGVGGVVEGSSNNQSQTVPNAVPKKQQTESVAPAEGVPMVQENAEVQVPIPAQTQVTPEVETKEFDGNNQPVTGMPENQQAISQLVSGVGDYLGIKVDFMDSLPDGAKLEDTKNALYDPESGTLYLNRNSFTVNPAESLGHELKHHLDETSPEIMQTFNKLIADDLTELGIQVGEKNRAGNMDEISSDIFGQIFARPDTWNKVAVKLEEKTPGIGQKFLQALQDFIKLIKDVIGKKFEQSPEVEQMVQHYEQLETEVVNILADLRRKKLAADAQVISDRTIASNADGSVRLPEFVPVEDIAVDAERFQFKEDRNKSGVVNQLNGKFEQEVARPLYLWEDNTGKRYVVEGHHRLDLARRSGTKEVLAYVHKETEGETADIARRRGVLMNIQDNKGTVRDFAAFFREDKITYQDAVDRGLFRDKEPQPKQGFLIGRYSTDTLYSAFRNGEIQPAKAAVIADIARGDESLEAAGIRATKGMTVEQLTAFMQLLKNTPRKQESMQGDLFGFDDSAIQTAETLAKLAVKHIKDVHESVLAAERAIKNPEAAKKLKVSVGKDAEKLYHKALEEEKRWANWHTDPELYQQLVREAGLGSIATEMNKKVQNGTESEINKAPLEWGERYDHLEGKGSKAIEELRKRKTGWIPNAWNRPDIGGIALPYGKTDIEVRSEKSKRKTGFGLAHIEENHPDLSWKIVDDVIQNGKITEKSFNRIIIEHVSKNNKYRAIVQINYDDFSGNWLVTAYQKEKTSPANPFSTAHGNKGVADNITPEMLKNNISKEKQKSSAKNKKADEFYNPVVGESFDDFYERFKPQRDAIIAKEQKSGWGNKKLDDLRSAADVAIWDAYDSFTADKGAKIDTWASKLVTNAIRDVFRQELKQNMPEGKSAVALDAQLESGDTVVDTIGIEDKDLYFDEVSIGEMPIQSKKRIVKWVKENGTRRQKLLVKAVFIDKENLSDAARAEGVGLKTAANARKVLGKIADKAGVRFSEKFLHHQIVPVIRDGVVRKEYEDLLNNKEFTRKTLPEIDQKAFDWIVKQGGILPAMEKILKNQQPGDHAVAELVRRHIMNSDVYAKHTTFESRLKMHKREIDARSSWGAEGRAMQMAAYKMDRLEAVQAFFDKLQEQMPDEKWQKLCDTVLKRTGVDIITLPDDIVKDRRKLDAVLREALAVKAPWYDKAYEFWINAILSGPRTHAANILGNAANTTYELGLKRFVEATINLLRGDKKSASFGDFKAMWGAVNWPHVRQQMSDAWNQEILNVDNSDRVTLSHVAIGGKLGRLVRIPGRALKAMDAFFKGIVQPMEAAAMAHRKARQKGLSGKAMEDYMVQEIANPDSASNAYGRGRALELMFQEDPFKIIKMISAVKKGNTPIGHILRFMLPFEKTPSNILKQGVRKSPLGIFNPRLIANTVKSAKGNQQAIDTAVELWAEQLLAWGTVMAIAFAGDDDDDDNGLPWITGSSARYGSNEANFMRDKIPPYSIRLGNAYYSYQRIEPFATSLALIVDSVQAWKNARKGKDGVKVTEDLLRSGRQIIAEKSYLDSLNQINKLVSEPKKNFTRWGTNFAASWVPNVIRQTIEIGNDELRDGRSRSYGEEFWRDQIDIVVDKTGFVQMYPKVDYFGRDVKKDAYSDEAGLWFLLRLTPIQVQDAAKDMDPIEKMIWVYNQKNINEQYYPGLPKPTFDHDKQDCYFDNEQYHDFAVEAGKLAHERLQWAVSSGKLNVDDPTQRDIDYIKSVFNKARREVKDRFIKQKRYHVR